MDQLEHIVENELLDNQNMDGNAAYANTMYERWMRVFKFASDNFWCQCCR